MKAGAGMRQKERQRRDEARRARRWRRNLCHVVDTLGWVVDTLKTHHMSRPGIREIVAEVDRRMRMTSDQRRANGG